MERWGDRSSSWWFNLSIQSKVEIKVTFGYGAQFVVVDAKVHCRLFAGKNDWCRLCCLSRFADRLCNHTSQICSTNLLVSGLSRYGVAFTGCVAACRNLMWSSTVYMRSRFPFYVSLYRKIMASKLLLHEFHLSDNPNSFRRFCARRALSLSSTSIFCATCTPRLMIDLCTDGLVSTGYFVIEEVWNVTMFYSSGIL